MLVSTFSAAANTFVTPKWFARHSVVWSIICIEFTACFGQGFFMVLNTAKDLFVGQIPFTVLCIFLEIHWSLGPDMIESFIFGDTGTNFKLGTLSQIEDNMSTYAPY